MTRFHRALGVHEVGSQKVSLGRVAVIVALCAYLAVALYVLWQMSQNNPAPQVVGDQLITTWTHYEGFVKEFGARVVWFLTPYVVGVGAKAIGNRNGSEVPS